MVLANKLQMLSKAIREIGLGGMLFDIGKKSVHLDIMRMPQQKKFLHPDQRVTPRSPNKEAAASA